jgi:hypothetical protein
MRLRHHVEANGASRARENHWLSNAAIPVFGELDAIMAEQVVSPIAHQEHFCDICD